MKGHLGLVLTPAEYATIWPIPYISPVHPGLLVIPPGPPAVPQYLRTEMRDNDKYAIRLFWEVDNMDKAFKKATNKIDSQFYMKQF